jgi:hypothetical protein
LRVGSWRGTGRGGSSTVTLWQGGDLALNTNAVVRAGDGGNATTSDDSLGGDGGVAGLVMVQAGTVTVARDLTLTSGRGGRGAQGGNVGPSFLLAVLPPL